MEFMTTPRLKTKYWQVRRAYVAFAIFGGNRVSEMKELKMIGQHQEGIEVMAQRIKPPKVNCPKKCVTFYPFKKKYHSNESSKIM